MQLIVQNIFPSEQDIAVGLKTKSNSHYIILLMIKKTLLFLGCALWMNHTYSQLVINEFQANNKTTVQEPESGEYEDWVELYNAGSEQIDAGGYYLTNEKSDTTKWQIPLGTTVPAKGFLLIWLDNKDSGLHTSFKLDKDGDIIILYDDSKKRLDIMNFFEMEEDVSYGRATDGGALWSQFDTPTPTGTNYTVASVLPAPEPIFLTKAGYYENAAKVELQTVIHGATIYYTTDGSTPTSNSAVYSAPIEVSKTSVIKAITLRAGYNPSRITTRSYFIGEHKSNFPVISIGVDPYDFFDENDGMYAMGPYASPEIPNYGANFWEPREEPVTFEYFVNGKQKVEVNAGIKIFGNWSRRYPQRSFSINCKNAYGDERMRYKFFKDKDNDVYKQIVVRNAGSDVYSLRYRDLMLEEMVSDRMDIDYQAGVPAIVYINGEYWGIMNLREKVQERYLKDNYGIKEDDVTLIANYRETSEDQGSISEFKSLFDFISSSDLSTESSYNRVKGMMDINEYINYNIAEMFYANKDWPGCNIKYWKENGAGNQWRWILYDLDQSSAYYEECNQYVNTLADAVSEVKTYWANFPESTVILRQLLKNEAFKNEFIQRFAAHMNTTFTTERFTASINRYDSIYADEQAYHLERWGYSDSLWNIEKENLLQFAEERPALMQGFIKDMFEISDMVSLTLKSKNEQTPSFEVCSVAMHGESVSGNYFAGIPLTVSVKQTTRKFSHWEDENGNNLSTDLSYTFTPENNQSLTAVFEQSSGLDNLFINELMASNGASFADEKGEYDDWIELYNANDFPVDVSGLYITDKADKPTKYQIPQGENEETVIPAGGYMILWADEEKSEGVLHTNFKLSSSGETIGLAQVTGDEVYWIDSVTYSPLSVDLSFGRLSDGENAFVHFKNATPNASNISATGVEDVTNGDYITVYPAVVHEQLTIETNIDEQLSIDIYSLSGNRVTRTKNTEGNSITQMDVEKLSPGIYLVKVFNAASSKIIKIIKK